MLDDQHPARELATESRASWAKAVGPDWAAISIAVITILGVVTISIAITAAVVSVAILRPRVAVATIAKQREATAIATARRQRPIEERIAEAAEERLGRIGLI